MCRSQSRLFPFCSRTNYPGFPYLMSSRFAAGNHPSLKFPTCTIPQSIIPANCFPIYIPQATMPGTFFSPSINLPN